MKKQLAEILKSLSGGEGLKHFSFSQLSKNKSIAMHIVDYWSRTEKQRRADRKRYKLGYGSLSGNVAQRLVGKYIFHGAEREEIKDKDYDSIFNHEYKLYTKESFDDRDKQIKEQIKDKLHGTTQQILSAVKNIFGDDELKCERYVDMLPEDLALGITGRLDFETDLCFAECKTKPPTAKDYRGDIKFYTQKLPNDPDPVNITQVAFYKIASGKTPFLFYANENDFIIFDDTHPALFDDHLEYCYQEMLNKAKTIQKLLILSNGDPKIAAQYVEKPDLNHWMMKDLSADQLKIIKQLWG